MTTQPEALRLADAIDPHGICLNNWRDLQDAAAELRRLHEEVQEQCRLNGMGSEREARLMAINQEFIKAYRKMYNSAAGYSNYCEDSASTRRCERDFEEAEAIFRAAIAKATGEQA